LPERQQFVSEGLSPWDTVPVSYHPMTNPDDIEDLIILANHGRAKTNLQQAQELFKLHAVIACGRRATGQ